MKDVPNLGPAYSRSDRRRRWTLIAWLVGGFLVAYAYVFISATASDSENLSGCQAVVSAVTSRHRLPISVSEPGSPAIFCDLGVHFPFLRTYYSVYIYGVLDKREQDSVVGNLRTYHRASHIPKILVQFLKRKTGGLGRTQSQAEEADPADRKLPLPRRGSNKSTLIEHSTSASLIASVSEDARMVGMVGDKGLEPLTSPV
jgi:hypothetical protein